MDKLISVLGSPLSFIILIATVVTVHELGHYLAGRAFGAAVESFSIGFGRPIVERRDRRGTRWRINWIPLGGFVKFAGEAQLAGDVGRVEAGPRGRPYAELSASQRLLVASGGPAANFVFAAAVFAALAMMTGVPKAEQVRVSAVSAGEPAAQAGFLVGDVLLAVEGREVVSHRDVQARVQMSAGDALDVRVLRDGRELVLTVTPVRDRVRDEALKTVHQVGRIGLAMQNVGGRTERLAPHDAVVHGVAQTGDLIVTTVRVLGRIITGRESLNQMSGPVHIFGISDNLTDLHMQQEGVPFTTRLADAALGLLTLAAVFSVGVGFFNLLPIPVLDGGAIMMCLIEMATGRPLPERVQEIGLSIGLACLISFALVVTWNDMTRPGGPLDGLQSLLS